MRAMILAAGLGTRMQPLSRHFAKPALPLLDEPLVLRLARQLAAGGVDGVIVNTHAHPETLREALGAAPLPIQFSDELPELLGSGGGIAAARSYLDTGETFVVVNGDMSLELDLAGMRRVHQTSGALATLALRDDPRKRDFGTIGYDTAGRVRRITSRLDLGGEAADGLFIGVHLMEPEIFEHMPQSGAFEIMPELYVPLLRQRGRIGCWLQPAAARWWPVGSPGELLDANLDALDGLDPASSQAATARVVGELRPPVWIGEHAVVDAGACVGPRAVIGAGARVSNGIQARDSLLLPGAEPPPGVAPLERAIGFGCEVWADG